jgi:hypothetical protein
MVREVTNTNRIGLFQALEAISGRLQSLAEVMHRMNGFELGQKVTLNQSQVDILVFRLHRNS